MFRMQESKMTFEDVPAGDKILFEWMKQPLYGQKEDPG